MAEQKSRIEQLEDAVLELQEKLEEMEKGIGDIKKGSPKKGLFGGKNEKIAILDLESKIIYPSKSAVGKALAAEFGEDALDRMAWYKIRAAEPERFEELAKDDPRSTAAWSKQQKELDEFVVERNKEIAAEAKKASEAGVKKGPEVVTKKNGK